MTIIAVRDGIIAADSLWSHEGQVRFGVPKLRRAGGLWWAAGGDLDDNAVFADWIGEEGRYDADPTEIADYLSASFAAIVLLPNGDAVWWGHRMSSHFLGRAPFAIGNGAESARAAFILGANAVTAAGVACLTRTDCGGPVVTADAGVAQGTIHELEDLCLSVPSLPG